MTTERCRRPQPASVEQYREQVRLALENCLPMYPPASRDNCLAAATIEPQRLHQAMRYAVLNGGKRVRAILVYATGHALGSESALLNAPACAVELIHAYSLVHDDLPAMDNDDLRRGLPTCHRAFDEATALLAGDALQSLAFSVLSGDPHLPGSPSAHLRMVNELAKASGAVGMAGGQAIDLAAVGQQLTLTELENMHRRKTGALIQASVRLGALSWPEINDSTLANLDTYANCIGLAFQIRDDILDVEGETDTLGKAKGADLALNKPTYPSLVGLAKSKTMATELHAQALACLDGLDYKAETLRWLADFIVTRTS